jgi:RND family efflux transporter MFP subunit
MRTLAFVAIGCLAATASFLAHGATVQPAAAASGPINLPCTVRTNEVDGEAYVPAEEAGKLMKVGVRAGQQVKAGDLLANIDDNQPRRQKEAADAEFRAASEKAGSTVDIEAATAAERVSALAYQRELDSFNKVINSVTKTELDQKKFEWDKMKLAIQQANHQKLVDGFTADAKKAEADLAQTGIQRREIRAPFDGVVQEIKQHQGEWVKPGDPVLKLIRVDQLSVEGRARSELFNPADLADRPVTVAVTIPGGHSVQFPGKIIFVGAEIEPDDCYVVRAEVDNRKENGQWVLRPGMQANMTIQSK